MNNFIDMKKMTRRILRMIPYVKFLYNTLKDYIKDMAYEPGHFYSPIVSLDEIRKRESEIWSGVNNKTIDGIDLNTEEQLNFVKEFEKYYSDLPFNDSKTENLRYYYKNPFYKYADAIILYSVLRYFKPKNIIEMGSGFSSALMLDTNDLFLDNSINFTFIEPEPERLYSLINEKDKGKKIIADTIQSVDISCFKQLKENDILFIDSSHVSKTGSDVNYILFEVLPKLNSGVLIHFHDIFYPFEYNKDLVYRKYSFNENYILKAFLMYNHNYKIKLFTNYLRTHYNDCFNEMPLICNEVGQNLWIQKL